MLRITTGLYKNKTLKVANPITRPFTERMRISVFDLLKDYISDADVLDLYAGSGAVGIEALSRGAKTATLIEVNKQAFFLIKDNLRDLGIGQEVEAYNMSVRDFVKQSRRKFDLIFLDPPFAQANTKPNKKGSDLVDISELILITHANSLVILRVEKEIYKHKNINYKGFKEIYAKKFGRSFVIFYSPQI